MRKIPMILAGAMMVNGVSPVVAAASTSQAIKQEEKLLNIELLESKKHQIKEVYEYQGKGDTKDLQNYKKITIKKQENHCVQVAYQASSDGKYALITKNGDIEFFHTDKNLHAYVKREIETSSTLQSVRLDIQGLRETQEPIGGSYTVYAKDEIKDENEKVLYQKDEEVVTVTSGEPITKDLPAGSYYIKQDLAADGYVISTDTYDFEVEKLEDSTVLNIVQRIENKMTVVEITHKDSDGNDVLGGVYSIMDSKGAVVRTFSDIENDSYIVRGLIDGETYTIVQNKSIPGYQDVKDVSFKVSGSEVQKINMVSAYNQVRIQVNTVLQGNDAMMRGVKLHLEGYEDGNKTWTSSITDAKDFLKIPNGTYKVVVDEVPEGYQIPNPETFVVDDQHPVQDITIHVSPSKTTIQITDEAGKELSGIQGLLTDDMHLPLLIPNYQTENENLVIPGVTNHQESEIKEIYGLSKNQSYQYQMKSGVDGYATDTSYHTIRAGENNVISLSPICAQLKIMNGSKEVSAKGIITDAAGDIYYEGDLNHAFQKIPAGSYHVKMTEVEKGYVKQSFDIIIKDQKETQVITQNVSAIKIGVSAQYGDTLVKNVEIEMKDEKGMVVASWKSGEQAMTKEQVAPGTYTLHVKNLPNRYVTPDDMEITVREVSELQNYQIKLQKPVVNLVARNEQEEVLDGVKYTINGNKSMIYTGFDAISQLERGTYALHFVEVPKGYVKPNDYQLEVKDVKEAQDFEIDVQDITISISVVSKEYRKLLKGVKLHLENTDYGFTSAFQAKGFSKVPAGTYKVVVDKVPEGFHIPTTKQTIEVKETAQLQSYTVEIGLSQDTEGGSATYQLGDEGNETKNSKNPEENAINGVKTGQSSSLPLVILAGMGSVGALILHKLRKKSTTHHLG